MRVGGGVWRRVSGVGGRGWRGHMSACPQPRRHPHTPGDAERCHNTKVRCMGYAPHRFGRRSLAHGLAPTRAPHSRPHPPRPLGAQAQRAAASMALRLRRKLTKCMLQQHFPKKFTPRIARAKNWRDALGVDAPLPKRRRLDPNIVSVEEQTPAAKRIRLTPVGRTAAKLPHLVG